MQPIHYQYTKNTFQPFVCFSSYSYSVNFVFDFHLVFQILNCDWQLVGGAYRWPESIRSSHVTKWWDVYVYNLKLHMAGKQLGRVIGRVLDWGKGGADRVVLLENNYLSCYNMSCYGIVITKQLTWNINIIHLSCVSYMDEIITY